ncbi:MAG: LysR family transcriptional regulator [Pseudomonadota bacterium]
MAQVQPVARMGQAARIRALEDSLNATLFHRHARGLILTEQGELLFDATSAMNKRLDAASARIRDSEEEVFGDLRVTTTIGFGTLWLAPRLVKLYEQYPDLRVDLMLEERVLDLPMREADVAIRMKEPSQADLIRKRLMSVKMQVFATQDYLDENGVPDEPEDVSMHRLICQSVNATQVGASASLAQHLMTYNVRSLLTVNNYFGVLQAVLQDLGLGILPDYVSLDEDRLIRVLPEIESADVPVFLAYPEELRQSKRIAAFRDFVQDEIIAYRKGLKQKQIV